MRHHLCDVCRSRRDSVTCTMTDTSGGTLMSICKECENRIRQAAAAGTFECVFCESGESPSRSTGLVFDGGTRVDVCDDCRNAVLAGEGDQPATAPDDRPGIDQFEFCDPGLTCPDCGRETVFGVPVGNPHLRCPECALGRELTGSEKERINPRRGEGRW